jgi:hypothetical protein
MKQATALPSPLLAYIFRGELSSATIASACVLRVVLRKHRNFW